MYEPGSTGMYEHWGQKPVLVCRFLSKSSVTLSLLFTTLCLSGHGFFFYVQNEPEREIVCQKHGSVIPLAVSIPSGHGEIRPWSSSQSLKIVLIVTTWIIFNMASRSGEYN